MITQRTLTMPLSPPLAGGGHALVLPPGLHPPDNCPVIIIGPGRQLHLSNVRVLYADSLSCCLQIGPGGQLFAQPEDKVQLINDSTPEGR